MANTNAKLHTERRKWKQAHRTRSQCASQPSTVVVRTSESAPLHIALAREEKVGESEVGRGGGRAEAPLPQAQQCCSGWLNTWCLRAGAYGSRSVLA